MPRGPGGTYVLPPGNPVVPGTIIESDWANPTMADMAQEMSDSLSRSGKGGMLAALRGLDGTAAVPTFSFTNEPSSGRYRDGPGQVVEAILGQPVVRYLASGLEQWDNDIMDWVPLTPRDALGTPFDPAPSNLTSTNVQDAIEEVNDKTGGTITADSVSYDDSNVYFPAATVQIAIDRLGTDVSGLANDILDNADAIAILQGEFDLLEPRVQQNEINIGTNTTDIALLDTRVTNHDTDISNNTNDIASIKLEQIQQNSDISQNASDIVITYNNTITNANNISTNANDISQNAADISSNDGRISTIEGLFNQPAGRLNPAYGGTGTTTGVATGTGNNVLSASPILSGGQWSNMTMINGGVDGANITNCDISGGTITGGTSITGVSMGASAIINTNLDGNCDGVTQAFTDNSTKLATTAFVNDFSDSYFLAIIQLNSNSNGWWWWVRNGAATRSFVVMGGIRSSGSGNVTLTFPTSFPTSCDSLVCSPYSPGQAGGGVDLTMAVRSIGTSSASISTNRDFTWIAVGR